MMERNGILLASKRVLFTVVIGIFSSLSLNADYKLVLTDVDGNQTQECVKSYSFSNNLESIANQSGVSKDIYSEEEVMTNKVYSGKPIYRKIVTIPNNLKVNAPWTSIAYKNSPTNVEIIIKAEFFGPSFDGVNALRANDNIWNSTYMLSSVFGYGYIGSERVKQLQNSKVVLEYTKTTDIASTSTTFKSYVLYIPSSSTNDEVITKDMENLGVQLLKGYSYDASTNSCTKN